MTWAAHMAALDAAALKAFGVTVVFAATTVKGIFDSAYDRIDVGDAGVSSFGPRVFVRVADLPSVPGRGDAITVDEIAYTVAEARPDGGGGLYLWLHTV